MSITKIQSRKVQKELDYTTSEHLLEELRVFEKQMGWTIFEIFDILKNKKADCFSITKEKPFNYLYARIREDKIFIRIQTTETETEFSILTEDILR